MQVPQLSITQAATYPYYYYNYYHSAGNIGSSVRQDHYKLLNSTEINDKKVKSDCSIRH